MGDIVQLVGYAGLLKSIVRPPVLSSIVIMTYMNRIQGPRIVWQVAGLAWINVFGEALKKDCWTPNCNRCLVLPWYFSIFMQDKISALLCQKIKGKSPELVP